jgi:hypothetical protein
MMGDFGTGVRDLWSWYQAQQVGRLQQEEWQRRIMSAISPRWEGSVRRAGSGWTRRYGGVAHSGYEVSDEVRALSRSEAKRECLERLSGVLADVLYSDEEILPAAEILFVYGSEPYVWLDECYDSQSSSCSYSDGESWDEWNYYHRYEAPTVSGRIYDPPEHPRLRELIAHHHPHLKLRNPDEPRVAKQFATFCSRAEVDLALAFGGMASAFAYILIHWIGAGLTDRIGEAPGLHVGVTLGYLCLVGSSLTFIGLSALLWHLHQAVSCVARRAG